MKIWRPRRSMAAIMLHVAQRVMLVQLKTDYDTDQGPAWISHVRFSRSWRISYWHGRTLQRRQGRSNANFIDVETARSTGCPDRTAIGPMSATAPFGRRSTWTSSRATKRSCTARRYPAENGDEGSVWRAALPD